MLKKTVLKISIFTFFLLVSLRTMSDQNEQELPPILDYYPDCAYQIIKEHKVVKHTDDPHAADVIFKILEKLRSEAQQVGANALILVASERSQVSLLRSSNERQSANSYRISYRAELIKNCSATNSKQLKLAPYNHQGKIALSVISTTISRPPVEITLPEKASLNHPQISNSEVSFNNGIYGVLLGSSYLAVLEIMGDPSVEVWLVEGEKIVGYGRRHWLHFQENKLVKVHNNSQYLSSMILNRVPLRDFFDDYKWQINAEIGYRTSLAKVKESLNILSDLDENNQLMIEEGGSMLTLQFVSDNDLETSKKIYVLNDFVLQQTAYKERAIGPQNEGPMQYKAVQQAYISLQQQQEIDWQELANKLAAPIARISVTVNSELRVYSNNLLVTTKNAQLTSIHFVKQTLLDPGRENTSLEPWYLGDFVQGKSVQQLEKFFLENAFSFDSEVEMEAEKYKLSLFFENIDGQDSLYEAKLELH